MNSLRLKTAPSTQPKSEEKREEQKMVVLDSDSD